MSFFFQVLADGLLPLLFTAAIAYSLWLVVMLWTYVWEALFRNREDDAP